MLRLTKTPAMLFSKKLKNIAIIQLIEKDLDKLCSIEGGDIKNNNSKKNYLYQSYVVHLMAGWQEFHKSLVEYAFSALEKKNGSNTMTEIARWRINDLLKKFNTPNTENINNLYKNSFGILNISQSWVFVDLNNKAAMQLLNKVLLARHQIAHKGVSIDKLSYSLNFENMEIIYKMACATEKHVFTSLNIE
ncbi:HEPN domain-containing protein [Leclercia sp. CFBP8987]|uniref:HEPN domain-containing protein n=1 Tax=Leclercia sp. CFBP8987 TaxID=3096525 RepID=UPI002A69A254|nr:HEPN domain-containing protein [Leclercia sp. CFBP8987]MDY0922785.1 HEPN domain-containing protein [Leclercia sp. CFBP8987]